ncbi:F-box protein CPR1-like [Argentina anserina]|uniref:F-box protein CPR1-like n=1 Tax=Argentina anserina TaxID=57926 RepID=UPI00217694F4|nr:F-box protein CPR1-like [Potentilla anserina]
MEEAKLPELREEVIELILCWLPVKSLIRFTCVSKHFHSIILSDAKFANFHFQAARDRKTLTRRLLYSIEGSPRVESIDLETPYLGDCSFAAGKPEPEPAAGEVFLLGSCNGFVFLGSDEQVFYMWNPSTGFSKKLVKLPDTGVKHDREMFCGVGYLPATDDYRVFVTYFGYYGDPYDYEAAIFSSTANAWEILEFNDLDISPAEGTLWKETLHWLDYRLDIVAFDLAQRKDHKFKKMLPPKGLYEKNERRDYNDIIQLSARECLLLVRFLNKASRGIHVWVMREYDMPDSWTKLFNLKFSDPPKERWRYIRGVWVMETSTVFKILVGDRNERALVKILHKDDKCSFCMVEGMCESVSYQESLLPIDD